MSSRETSNAKTARRLHTEVWDGNLDLVDEILADDYVEHSSAHPEGVHGPEEFKDEVEMLVERLRARGHELFVEGRGRQGQDLAEPEVESTCGLGHVFPFRYNESIRK